MLILLPPSEGKTAPTHGPPLSTLALSTPELNPVRERVLNEVIEVSDRLDAPTILGVGRTIAHEVARNTQLRSAATAPASQVYTGVLYAAAGLDRLTGVAKQRAEDSVRVVSGLWGLVSPADPIPAYRLSMGVDLPGIGPLAACWRDPLSGVLNARALRGDLVVDCRSSAYLAVWKPPRHLRANWVQVRVLRELDGQRSVVSHHAKHTRGVLTRHLLTRSAPEPKEPWVLANAVSEMFGAGLRDVELTSSSTTGAAQLSLVIGPN